MCRVARGLRRVQATMTEVKPPTVDDLFEEQQQERDCDIDREFWSNYLRDMHDYNEKLLESKPDRWIDARATEEMNA